MIGIFPLKMPRHSSAVLERYFRVAAAFGVLYFSVQLGFWDGLYIDFNLARVMLFITTIGVGVILLLSKTVLRSFDTGRCLARALMSSAATCIYVLISRVITSPVRIAPPLVFWMIASVIIVHFFFAAAWFAPTSRRRWLLAFGLVGALQFTVLLLVAILIDHGYPYFDRAPGVFGTTSPHLENAKFNRQPLSESRSAKPQLKVLNLNAWIVENWIPSFIATASKDVDRRMELLPSAIDSVGADVVIFEEVWTSKRRTQLKRALYDLGFRFAVQGSNSHAALLGIGNGLLIVSKLPLDPEIKALTFSAVTRFDENFPFVRKGVIKTRLQLPTGNEIDLYATHLGASDTVLQSGIAWKFDSAHLAIQKSQAAELAVFMASTHTSRSLILAADLNTTPHKFLEGTFRPEYSEVYSMLTCLGTTAEPCLHLEDAAAHYDLITYDSKTNPYVKAGYFNYEPAGQIDYLFNLGPDLRAVDVRLVFTDIPLSDHYGLLTTYQVRSPTP